MKKGLTVLSALLLLSAWSACSSKPESTGEKSSPSALDDTTPGALISGDELTDDYIKLLCEKYDHCELKAFKDRSDCHNRMKTVLSTDSKWRDLSLNKKALKKCLSDFEDYPCEDFITGKAPQSCQKL
jgi:hypothetical protein